MGVRSLGYIRLETAKLDAWREFGTDILGLMPVEGGDPNSLYYRMDHYPPRLVISPAGESKLTAVGFEVLNPKDLDQLVKAVEGTGTKVIAGTEEEAAERRVTGFAKFEDPGGTPVELFYGPVLDHVTVQTPLVSGFVTENMGMGHIVVSTSNAKASYDFYTDVLGFYERNTMTIPNMGRMWFLSPSARHHTLGIIGDFPGPMQLFHFMLETASIDDVGRALDRIAERNVPLMLTLGKHTNDHMVSFYVYTPDKFAVEFGFAGITVPEPETTYAITAPSFWGHKFQGPPPE